jgi:DNA-binding CsgD family transcriptional regulator
MSENYSETFVFLLHGDGTFAWINTERLPTGDPIDNVLGKHLWKRCGPDDEDRLRDDLVRLVLDQTDEVHTVVRNIEGERLLVSMHRLPIVQPAQHAVVGWCHRLSDEVLALTDREREVLLQVCEELTSEQIAKRLHIAPATVETHRQNIAKKLGTNSVVGQVRAAVRGGLVDP